MKLSGILILAVIFSGCVTNAVRNVGGNGEGLIAERAIYNNRTIYIQYHVKSNVELKRVQQIDNAEYISSIEPINVYNTYGHDDVSTMKGKVEPEIGSMISKEISTIGQDIDVINISRQEVFRHEWEWYHNPSQALLIVSVPIDIILSPIYLIAMCFELTQTY